MAFMDFIRRCFEEHNSALTKRLIIAEFTIDQARLFLPEAASGIFESAQNTSLFQTIACLFSNSPYQLPRNIDVNSIAIKSGVNSVKVAAGLHAIAPVLLQAFAHNKSGQITINQGH